MSIYTHTGAVEEGGLDYLEEQCVITKRDGILNHAKAVYEFKLGCEKKRGGSYFTSRMLERMGYEKEVCSRWVAVGEYYQQLFSQTTLPSSLLALYLLTTIPQHRWSAALQTEIDEVHARLWRGCSSLAGVAPGKRHTATIQKEARRSGPKFPATNLIQ